MSLRAALSTQINYWLFLVFNDEEKSFISPTLGADPIKKYCSKITHSFCKLRHSDCVKKLAPIIGSSLQRRVSWFSPKSLRVRLSDSYCFTLCCSKPFLPVLKRLQCKSSFGNPVNISFDGKPAARWRHLSRIKR